MHHAMPASLGARHAIWFWAVWAMRERVGIAPSLFGQFRQWVCKSILDFGLHCLNRLTLARESVRQALGNDCRLLGRDCLT